jgi:amino acid transporter
MRKDRKALRRPRRPLRTRLFGRPLATADAEHQTLGRATGLAVFASDALSSTAYATQEILIVLAAAGAGALALAFPVSLGIVVLLAIVTISYRQTIFAYPGGGGAYVVARENLGVLAAQVASAALLSDYVLTVSVSVSSGVAQLASAFPALHPHRVEVAVALVLFVMFVNLRGVKESGFAFAVPTYCFIFAMLGTVGVGLARFVGGSLGTVASPPPLESGTGLAGVGAFLVLHAFSNGTTALTGVEAISNGITAFREPRSRNAAATLVWMAFILGALFLGITFLAGEIGAVPSEQETVISQLARTALGGRNVFYLATIGLTTLILVLAANTAFADFPRLAALQAGDGFLPRQLTYRGSRLVFSRGIVVLALVSSLLIVFFQARVTALIPLYAIGVFLSFSLSQAGMTLRWWRMGASRHRLKMALNGFGCLLTSFVTLVFAVTKFQEGAWVVLVVLPVLVLAFFAVRAHYRETSAHLSLEDYGAPPRTGRHRVILALSGVHRGTLEALRYARALSRDVTAVHVSIDDAEAEELRAKWNLWGDGVRLVILPSPYRLLLEPLLDYVTAIADGRQPDEIITIVVPQFVPRRAWENLLHAQTALFLRMALLFRRGIMITNVPYQLGENE